MWLIRMIARWRSHSVVFVFISSAVKIYLLKSSCISQLLYISFCYLCNFDNVETVYVCQILYYTFISSCCFLRVHLSQHLWHSSSMKSSLQRIRSIFELFVIFLISAFTFSNFMHSVDENTFCPATIILLSISAWLMMLNLSLSAQFSLIHSSFAYPNMFLIALFCTITWFCLLSLFQHVERFICYLFLFPLPSFPWDDLVCRCQ